MRKAARREGQQPGQPFSFWLVFWALAEEVGEHYVWRGKVDRQGRPVFLPGDKGPALPAAHAAWAYERRQLAAGTELRTACGREHCVRAEHQEVSG
jgi:hypothetical protein